MSIIDHVRTASGVICRFPDHCLRLTWYGEGIVRVRAWPGPAAEEPAERSLAVVAALAQELPIEVRSEGDRLVISGGRLRMCVEAAGGRVSIQHADGRLLVEEAPGGRVFLDNGLAVPAGDRRAAAQTFRLAADLALYGLGQFPDDRLDWRGRSAELQQANRIIVVPFLATTGGWGLLWDNASFTRFRDDADGMHLWSQVADAIDYYICQGDDADAVTAGYRRLTGRAAMLPRWACGFWQSKERYTRAEELVAVVDEYRRRGVGLDVIVQDWAYWGPFNHYPRWNAMDVDPEVFGDLPGALRAVHERHARALISVWPTFGIDTAPFRDFAQRGLLFYSPFWPDAASVRCHDAFSPEAQDLYWRHLRERLLTYGVDGWWMDATEPELFGNSFMPQFYRNRMVSEKPTAAGSWPRVLNAYSLAATCGLYQRARAQQPERRVCILTRSAFAGQQRTGAIAWSGDTDASWWTLRTQVRAGLNLAAAGYPYWTTDNGAFFTSRFGSQFPGGVADPAYREFYLRWQQWSVFLPVMRSHGTQTPREIWRFGEKGETIYDALADTVRLRYRLLPYIYSLAGRVAHDHGDFLRPLGLAFPQDRASAAVADQFLCGPALMVAPVLHPILHAPSFSVEPIRPAAMADADGKTGALTLHVYHGDHLDHAGRWTDTRWPEGCIELGDRIVLERCRIEVAGSLLAATSGPHRLIVHGKGPARIQIDGAVAFEGELGNAATGRERFILDRELQAGQALALSIAHGGAANGDRDLSLTWIEANRPHGDTVQAAERRVHLPAGSCWHDFWTGERYAGAQDLILPVSLERIPLLVRAGAILPLGPDLQHTGEQPPDPLELRIYPGADGSFTLYEDAGEGYACEIGQHTLIPLAWDDRARQLRIGQRQGDFPGMLRRRTFRVVLVGPGRGTHLAPCAACQAEVVYDGNAVTLTI